MTKLLTPEETKLCQDGFFHCVDNGYGKVETLEQLCKVIGRFAEHSKREMMIAKMDGINDPQTRYYNEAFVKFAEYLEMRLGA